MDVKAGTEMFLREIFAAHIQEEGDDHEFL
jgi:hypothetical protein